MSDAPAPVAADLAGLEEVLGYAFEDRSLLEMAVTHSSFANERATARERAKEEGRERGEGQGAAAPDNERLEFLGDSVVGMVAAGLLYRAHSDWREGELTRALHQLVDRRGLATLARTLSLGDYMRLGRTELRSDGRGKETILADGMEAVIGAVYLDGGIEPVERFARRVFGKALEAGVAPVAADPKTRFQEWVMTEFGVFPTYRVANDSGVEGDEERFTSELLIEGRPVARGVGRSKRDSERGAAADAQERQAEIAAELGPAPEEDADA